MRTAAEVMKTSDRARSCGNRPSMPYPVNEQRRQGSTSRAFQCRRRAEIAVGETVTPGGSAAPGGVDLADGAIGAHADADVDQRGRVGGVIMGDVPEGQHPERLTFLEAGLGARAPAGTFPW